MATGLAAALPVIVSTIRALQDGWTPEGDQAVIATRSYDVLTSITPLVGPWSSSSNLVGENIYYAGPLLYWLLAIPARLPVAAFPIVMGAVNVAALVGAVALARRHGGRGLMFAAAGAIAIMCASLHTQVLYDIWGSTAPLLVLPLLFFASWSVACGDYRLLPVAVLTASFAMQCNLIFLVPSAAALGVAIGGLVISRLRVGEEDRDARSLRRWSVAAAVVAVVCWSAPLADQGLAWAGSDRGLGNLENLVEASGSRDEPAGSKAAAYAVVRAIGIPPWWLREPPTEAERTFEIFERPGVLALLSTGILLLAAFAVSLLGLRRGRRDVVAAGALTLALCGALRNRHGVVPEHRHHDLRVRIHVAVGVAPWDVGVADGGLVGGDAVLAGARPRSQPEDGLRTGRGARQRDRPRCRGGGRPRPDQAAPPVRAHAVRRGSPGHNPPGPRHGTGPQLAPRARDRSRPRASAPWRDGSGRSGRERRVGQGYARRERSYDHIVEIGPGPPPEGGRRIASVRLPRSKGAASLTLRPGR